MLSDEELVHEIRRGVVASFDELYRRYSRRLFAYVRRFVADRDLAEDILQDVFMTVLSDRSLELREGRFGGWLFTVARNRCLSERRSAERQASKLREAEVEGAAFDISPGPSPEQSAQRREQLRALNAALASLPETHQDALMLRELANLSYRQIAAVQDVPEGTAKSRLHHAIRALRDRLEVRTS